MEKTFEEWIDSFLEFVRGLGYKGTVDKESFRQDWEDGQDPFHMAEDFVLEMQD
ncbi:hypothetical protein [Chryseobacterium gallinarum]|uniref:hypothetical protein n=1 Tax=Chryseobacterium gallinarum TaxID=1324352 RepID=UPI000B049154|nr:hypothetical protein [Chryseobacterium gallinarum]